MKITTQTYSKIRKRQIRLLKMLNTAWVSACQHDNIKPDSKCPATFSSNNPFKFQYERIARMLGMTEMEVAILHTHSGVINSQIRWLRKLDITWSWACQHDGIRHNPKHFAIFTKYNPYIRSYERIAHCRLGSHM